MSQSTDYVPYSLPPTTIIPENKDLYIPYFNSLYQDVSNVVNNKDNIYFQFSISDTASNIPFLSTYGAYIICISGTDSTLPTITASLCKSDATAAGSIATLGSQVGTGDWAGNALTITSTATNFQVAHDRTGILGNFNIKFIGTQI